MLRKCLFVALVAVTGCSSMSGGDDGGGGGGGGGGSGGSGSGGGGGGNSNWTEMALPSGHDSDSVTAIYYASPTQGLIGTAGGADVAGGIFNASATSVTGVAYDGSAANDVDFYGFAKTPTGYYAYTDIEQTIVGDANGNFTNLGANGTQGGNISPVLGAYLTGNETVLVTRESIWSAAMAPGSSADYDSIWAPEANPTVPDPVPAADCQFDPIPNDPIFTNQSTVSISTDGKSIIYTSADDDQGVPEICVSTNGGSAFLPTTLPGDGAVAPSGVVMPNPADPSVVIVYNAEADNDPIGNYIMRSTNGGQTFTNVALPTTVASKSMAFYDAFFAPDAMHGWIIGLDDGNQAGLALVTTDGGQTWAEDATGLATVDTQFELGLRAGFALDATHVWIGGDNGVLFAYTPH
jgi:hypothetical protein